MQLARELQVARGTVQARLDKLQSRGVVTGFDPDLHLATLGYDVMAFVTLEIAQGRLDDVIDHLRNIPEVRRRSHHRSRRLNFVAGERHDAATMCNHFQNPP